MIAARWLVAVGLSASLLGGCGGAQPPGLSAEAARVLGSDVDAVSAAARGQDVTALRGTLRALRGHVEHYQASNELSTDRASRIMAAAARVATDVQPPAPQPVTPQPVAPQPVSADPVAPEPAPERVAPEPPGPDADGQPRVAPPAPVEDDGNPRSGGVGNGKGEKGEKCGKGGKAGRDD